MKSYVSITYFSYIKCCNKAIHETDDNILHFIFFSKYLHIGLILVLYFKNLQWKYFLSVIEYRTNISCKIKVKLHFKENIYDKQKISIVSGYIF